MRDQYEILIIGGGNAGISVAAQLLKRNRGLDIAIVEPSEKHYYQPAYTLVGGGVYEPLATVRDERTVIPSGVEWIKDRVTEFDLENNGVKTVRGHIMHYEYLVVCPGIQLNWHKIDGLSETLGKNNVCSNYSFDTAAYTWKVVKDFEGGTALFTSANTPVKCGGAPQKAMYMSADYFRRKGILDKTDIQFCNAGKILFGIEKYRIPLQQACDRYGVTQHHRHNLIKIDGPNKVATFEVTDPDGNKSIVAKHFDMIHVTPPQSAPDFVRKSDLADKRGWVDVDKHTLQHVRYKNVFSLGDVTNTRNAKTGAAIRKQAPVVVDNIMSLIRGEKMEAEYHGYGSCPLVTAKGKLVLAEFDYDNQPQESFPFDQGKERWSMYMLKRYVLPWMYWNRILTGKA